MPFDSLVRPECIGKVKRQWPALRYVEFCDLAVHPELLWDFAQAHGDTLRTIRLCGVKLMNYRHEEDLEDHFAFETSFGAREPPYLLQPLLVEAMGGLGEVHFIDSYTGQGWGRAGSTSLAVDEAEAAAEFDEHLRYI